MAIAVAIGLLLATALVLSWAFGCSAPIDPNRHAICEIVHNNPPWILVTSLVASPAVLLTWFWRTAHKEADIDKGRADIDKGREDVRLAQEAQFTQRFGSAVELLGNEQLATRLGAIYALERLAGDSRRDHGPIVETLAAFIRMRTSTVTSVPYFVAEVVPTERKTRSGPPEDVVAALTVLSRREHRDAERAERLDLARLSIPELAMTGGDLSNTGFFQTSLAGARLVKTALRNSSFIEADLANAQFVDCDLSGSRFDRADVANTTFQGCKLSLAEMAKSQCNGSPFVPTADEIEDLRRGYAPGILLTKRLR